MDFTEEHLPAITKHALLSAVFSSLMRSLRHVMTSYIPNCHFCLFVDGATCIYVFSNFENILSPNDY